MLDMKFVPTETLQDRKQDWLSTIRTSLTASLERHLIVLAREPKSNSIEIDRMPEARIRHVDVYHQALALGSKST